MANCSRGGRGARGRFDKSGQERFRLDFRRQERCAVLFTNDRYYLGGTAGDQRLSICLNSPAAEKKGRYLRRTDEKIEYDLHGFSDVGGGRLR